MVKTGRKQGKFRDARMHHLSGISAGTQSEDLQDLTSKIKKYDMGPLKQQMSTFIIPKLEKMKQ